MFFNLSIILEVATDSSNVGKMKETISLLFSLCLSLSVFFSFLLVK